MSYSLRYKRYWAGGGAICTLTHRVAQQSLPVMQASLARET